jgi:hypothetical protein
MPRPAHGCSDSKAEEYKELLVLHSVSYPEGFLPLGYMEAGIAQAV